MTDSSIDIAYLPAPLHNRPDQIVPAIEAQLRARQGTFGQVLLGYGDCGTGGGLDRFVAGWNTEHPTLPMQRLDGDHCYEFFTGTAAFREIHADELGTFFLTDFIVVNFESLIWKGLGLADHPELRDMYFGNYTRALYLAQDPSDSRIAAAKGAAATLGLRYEMLTTGLAPFADQFVTLAQEN